MRSAKWPRKVASMLRYLSFLVQERRSFNDGKAAVFGLQKLEARGNKTLLAEAKEALAGWAKRAPPRQRRPVPEEIVSLMTVDLLDTGARPPSATRVFSATASMLLLDTYIRPSALWGGHPEECRSTSSRTRRRLRAVLVNYVAPPRSPAKSRKQENWMIQFLLVIKLVVGSERSWSCS